MTRKRSRYRPKPVMSNPLAMMQPAPAARSAKVMRTFLTAIDSLARSEHPGVAEWRDLSDAINTVETLALHQGKLVPGEVMPTVQAAIDAMVDASRRFRAGQRMGVSGEGLRALRDVLAIYEQCLEGLTEREMAMAQAETQRRLHEAQRHPRASHTVVSPRAELLEWHAVGDALPDDDTTVLMWFADGEWFSGWHEDGRRIDAASGGAVEGVTHLAAPEGPAA